VVSAKSSKQPAAGLNPNDLGIEFELLHSSTPYDWDAYEGIYHWRAQLTIKDRDAPAAGSRVIATAHMVSADSRECDDFCVDLDCLDADLGRMAHVADRTLLQNLPDEEDIPVGEAKCYANRVLFVTDVALDPFWRGRGLGPATVKIAARAIGGVDGIFLIAFALAAERDGDGVWITCYDSPRPGRAAQAKVRKAWTDAGFVRRMWRVYSLPLEDWGREQAHDARQRLMSLSFGPDETAWWTQSLTAV
jgi:hypothetical protein